MPWIILAPKSLIIQEIEVTRFQDSWRLSFVIFVCISSQFNSEAEGIFTSIKMNNIGLLNVPKRGILLMLNA